MDSSMLWASRVACSFSSWSVASLTRNEVGSILLIRFGLKEALLERKLRPWLRSGFREGILDGNETAPRDIPWVFLSVD